ncbi:MAG TPA: decaprenyl-phosphate phosphoribosyltransferase [Burkholderiales bacterium]|nr:decaprenyl-phosphate phosphoribosyltransferase [Burkholderiales bacterium]
MSRVLAFVELLRPKQWVKNAFVLVGLVFGHAYRDPVMVNAALCATLAFCLASGAVYAFNDARDAVQDRGHPDKRDRPVARGAIASGEATVFSAVIATLALALAACTGWKVAAFVAAYLVLSAAYTLRLKRVPVLDVFSIAAGFMLRLLAGTAGIGIAPSNWLLACGFLLTLFLGFAKRRAEIGRLAEGAGLHRPVLEDYSAGFLDKAIMLCAAGMTVAYAAYTLAAETALIHGTGGLILTLPWVLLGTLRYLYRLRFRGGGGDPAEELLRDPLLAAAVAGWIATVLWLIG